MTKVIEVSFEENGAVETWRYNLDPMNSTINIGDVKRMFAAMNGLSEDAFRFVLKSNNREILDDSKLLSEFENNWEVYSNKSSSESGEEKEGETKVQMDQDEKEKSKQLVKLFDKYHEMALQPDQTSHKLSQEYKKELRQEIYTVMRMAINRPEESIPPDGDSEDQAGQAAESQVLYIAVELTEMTIGIVTANDDVKYIQCRRNDTLQETRDRFARLFDCFPVENFEMSRSEDTDIYMDGEMAETLEEIGIEDGDTFFAKRKGRQTVRVIFEFAACLDIDVNMDKSVKSLRKKICNVAPDLRDVNFFMWYNGIFLEEEKSEAKLGEIIMGSSILRVIIEIDTTLKANPEALKTPVLTIKKISDKNRQEDKKNGNSMLRRYRSSSGGRSDDSKEKDHKEFIFFEVNERATRLSELLVECHDFKLEDNAKRGKYKPSEFDNGAEYEAPISLDRLKPYTPFYKIRNRIASFCNDLWTHQILYRNGERFEKEDDCKTMRELGFSEPGKLQQLFKEPSITVNVVHEGNEIPMTVAGRGTSFGHLADLLVNEGKVSMKRERIVFKYNDRVAPSELLFSDLRVTNGSSIEIMKPFEVRVWHMCCVYDNDMFWPHTTINDLKAWIAKETGIPINKQVIVNANNDAFINMVDVNKKPFTTLEECKITEIREIEVFEEGDLPDRLVNAARGALVESEGGEHGGVPAQFIESREGGASDEDDPEYEP